MREVAKKVFNVLIFTCLLVILIVNNGNILTGGGSKNERERVQRELLKNKEFIQCVKRR